MTATLYATTNHAKRARETRSISEMLARAAFRLTTLLLIGSRLALTAAGATLFITISVLNAALKPSRMSRLLLPGRQQDCSGLTHQPQATQPFGRRPTSPRPKLLKDTSPHLH